MNIRKGEAVAIITGLSNVITKTKQNIIEYTNSISTIFLACAMLSLYSTEWEPAKKLTTACLCAIVIALACGVQFGARIALRRISRELPAKTD
jgi:hypothetical protein